MKLVSQNIKYSIQDWYSFETSWDFKIHPLVLHKLRNLNTNEASKTVGIKFTYNMWDIQTRNSFNKLKENEEELNRIFIDIYGLQQELTPKVKDKTVNYAKFEDVLRKVK